MKNYHQSYKSRESRIMANENKMILNRVSSDFTLPQVKTHVNSKKSLP